MRMAARQTLAGGHLPRNRANTGALALIRALRRVAAPAVRWDDGRLSVRFPLRRGADVAAVLGELTAQLGGGAAAEGSGGGCSGLAPRPGDRWRRAVACACCASSRAAGARAA